MLSILVPSLYCCFGVHLFINKQNMNFLFFYLAKIIAGHVHENWLSVSEIKKISVMLLVGGQGGLKPTRNLGFQFTLFKPGGQIIPTALLLAHPESKT